MMQSPASRRGSARTSGVAAGSVWESRLKLDQAKGGIKVFNADDENGDAAPTDADEAGLRVYNLRLRRNQSELGVAERRKRKNWSPPEAGPVDVGGIAEAGDKSPSDRLSKARPSPPPNSPMLSEKASTEAGEEMAAAKSPSNANGPGQYDLGEDTDQDCGGGDAEEMEVETDERESFDDKEVDMAEEEKKTMPRNAEEVAEDKEVNQIRDIPLSSNTDAKTLTGTEEHPATDSGVVSPSPETMAISDPPKAPRKVIDLGGFLPDVKRPTAVVTEDEYYQSVPETQHRIQSIVDLVMWRDIPSSAFVFGIGSFLLLSSSYAKDLNFSFVSAISYLGLVYLAAIFLYKSLIRRVAENWEENEQGCMVREEEAIWLAKLLLPYINEVLLKLKALFSGEPTTTMKMGAMLFVLARCGGAITFWTMAKLAFFGLFTIPKICSSYSLQLAQYGKFWTERGTDAWESCQHKKAVSAAVFTVVWNFSSTVARVWAGFMLAVALRFFQEHLAATDAVAVAEAEDVYEGGEAEQHLQPRQQAAAAAEDAKQRAGGASLGRVAAAAGRAGSPLQRGPVRAYRPPGGAGPARVGAREKKWS